MIYLLAVLSNAATVSWNGNVTISNNQNGQFNYRGSTITNILGSLVASGGSVDVQQSGSGNTTTKFTGSISKFEVSTTYPRAWSASLVVEASGGTANYAGQGSFTGLAYSTIEEVDPSNKTVTTINLDKLTWTPGVFQDPTTNNGLAQLEYTASGSLLYPFSAADAIKLTAVMSTNYGKLDTGAVLTPNAVETVFEVKNWKFSNSANNLRLTIWIGQGSRTSSGIVSVNTGDFKNWVIGTGAYASYFSTASVGKNGANVDVSVNIDVSARDPAELPAILSAAATLGGTGSWNANRVYISFPAGVSSIVYDPAVGANEVPQSPAAGTTAAGTTEAPRSNAWALKPFIALGLVVLALLI